MTGAPKPTPTQTKTTSKSLPYSFKPSRSQNQVYGGEDSLEEGRQWAKKWPMQLGAGSIARKRGQGGGWFVYT